MWELMKKLLIILAISSLLLIFGCTSNQISNQKTSASTQPSIETTQKTADPPAITKEKYIRYTKSAYDKSVEEGKVVLLDFYANWCPICRSENPKILSALDEINNPNVIAYQVHFNDDETNQEDKEITKQFGITYQHTKVIIKDGKQISKSLEVWT